MSPPGDPILDEAATALAARVRRREISPLELCDAHIARIEAVNPALNALAAERFDLARREARQADERLAHTRDTDELPPFFGVPCTMKEFLSVAGMPLTAGIWSRRHVVAQSDATVVRRMRAAGAIILGVTNVPEGGMWMETDNQVYGRTRNPWNLGRTAGGSSGGEAALIAAGASPLGIGSDIGGSIRIPSAFCGVVGHKPTGRMVPNTGYWPPLHGEISAFLCSGPMARRVADLWPVMKVIAGPDGESGDTRPFPLGDPAAVSLRDVTVYPVEWNGRVRVRADVRETVRRAAAAMESRGARVATLRTRGFERAFEIWSAMLAGAPGKSYSEVLGDGTPINPWRELLKAPFGMSRFTGPALIIAAAEILMRKLPSQMGRFIEAGHRLQEELEAELGPNGVLLHPPYSRTAPRHYGPMLTPFDFVYTAIFNVLEFPVTVLPTGFDDGGLPLGVQIAARRGNDHLTVATAAALEEEFGGWVRATPAKIR